MFTPSFFVLILISFANSKRNFFSFSGLQICIANQRRTGGLILLEELVSELNKTKSSHQTEVCQDDAVRAIRKLHCLGNGFKLIKLSDSRHLVQSVPGELNMDHTQILKLAESHGAHVDVQQCVRKYGVAIYTLSRFIVFCIPNRSLLPFIIFVTSFYKSIPFLISDWDGLTAACAVL